MPSSTWALDGWGGRYVEKQRISSWFPTFRCLFPPLLNFWEMIKLNIRGQFISPQSGKLRRTAWTALQKCPSFSSALKGRKAAHPDPKLSPCHPHCSAWDRGVSSWSAHVRLQSVLGEKQTPSKTLLQASEDLLSVLPLWPCWEWSFRVPHTQNSIHWPPQDWDFGGIHRFRLWCRWSFLCKPCGEMPPLKSPGKNMNLIVPTHPPAIAYRESKMWIFSSLKLTSVGTSVEFVSTSTAVTNILPKAFQSLLPSTQQR